MRRGVLGVEGRGLRGVAGRSGPTDEAPLHTELRRTHTAIRAAQAAGVRAAIPPEEPRDGVLRMPRSFVHRVAWHTADHLSEIEDRIS